MSKRKRNQKDKNTSTEGFQVNPFDGVAFEKKLDLAPGFAGNAIEPKPKSEKNEANKAANSILYIRLSKKGRAGKIVTLISGFDQLKSEELNNLGRDLRKSLGSGGTAYEDTIEIQGDHRSISAKWLQNMGYKVKGEIN